MADRIEPFVCPIPAGTAIAVPAVTDLAFDDGIVTQINITVPPGPSGFVGFQFTHKGGQVIPLTGNTFIVADDRIITWPVSNMPQASGWQLRAYNTDIFNHTLYIEFLIDEIPIPGTPAVTLVPIG